jgi:NDP-sugar pyrophosphorylase family protein
VDAVVMAAGEGRRLRPLTERYAKPVLPIDGRPVVVMLLRELRAAGIGRVTVVTGHLAEQVERLLDGFPLELRFVRQSEPLGSADAVRRGLRALPAVVVAADTVFTAGDLARFAAVDGHAIAARRDPPPAPPHRYALGVAEGRVTKVLDDDRRCGGSASRSIRRCSRGWAAHRSSSRRRSSGSSTRARPSTASRSARPAT